MSVQNVKQLMSRLSAEDRTYLEQWQAAYEEALEFYRSFYEQWLEKQNSSKDSFTVIESRNIDDWIYAEAKDIQWYFVFQIYEHFSHKYRIRFAHRNRIGSETVPCFGKKTEEQIREKLRSRSFMTVVLDIFDQMEGMSFEDMFIHQLKKRMRAVCIDGDGTSLVNIKNDTLQYHGWNLTKIIDDNKYACEGAFVDGLPDALSVFLYGEAKRLPGCDFLYPKYSLKLTSREIREGFDTDHLEKVKRIKFFKNGRIDIKFDTEENAMAFAKEWCGFSDR